MTVALAASLSAAVGVHLVYTSAVLGRGRLRTRSTTSDPGRRAAVRDWLTQAGLADVRLRDLVAVCSTILVASAALVYAIFGAIAPAIAVGVFASTFPVASSRLRRQRRLATAQEAWPRMLEEIRILTGSLGRSIPQALFEAGRRGPEELRPAFAAAQREWLVSTDFERTLTVLKSGLADPTADVTCETLLVAHTVGGSDLDRRLTALVDDRIQDTQGRKDARAKQAGARFARRFVLFVPFGMALAGMSVGNGRDAFRTASGQLLTLVAVAMVVLCWAWAGRILRIPAEERVFSR